MVFLGKLFFLHSVKYWGEENLSQSFDIQNVRLLIGLSELKFRKVALYINYLVGFDSLAFSSFTTLPASL